MSQIRTVGDGVPYFDGAEDELLQVMKNAQDRSIGSDELASHIHDWPTRYHLTRARANLLMPFNLEKGVRVLDVGCGTGALTRQFAEWGNNVTGLEGSNARAQVAQERVREFENAEIVSGSLQEYISEGHDNEFDVVLLCGVLEYSAEILGGGQGSREMLSHVKRLLKDDGLLIIAIENQIGMKYLAGYNEDHLGVPWIGLNDYYGADSKVRTWTKSALKVQLNNAGFRYEKWFSPFPDYKITTSVVSENFWDLPDSSQLARQFIRNPIDDGSSSGHLNMDSLSFWRLFLQTSNPEEFSNSFLVAASVSDLENSNYFRDGLLWSNHEMRSAKFSNKRTLFQNDLGQLALRYSSQVDVSLGKLSNHRTLSSVLVGENMEDWLMKKCGQFDIESATSAFLTWWNEAKKVIENENDGICFDVLPRNFILDSNDRWQYIDSEWFWHESITNETILARSLYYLLLERMIPLRLPIDIDPAVSLLEAITLIGELIGEKVQLEDFENFVTFETEVQSLVMGKPINFDGISIILDEKIGDLQTQKALIKPHIPIFKTISERDALVAERDKTLAQNLQIKTSLSWRITAPVRSIAQILKKISRKI
jgi:cyclopropane fatty-acyl-phospholipid synthase-like methyltransferase